MLLWMIFGMLFVGGLILFSLVFWLWMLIDCILNEKLQDKERLLWVIIIIFAAIIGAILYLALGKKGTLHKKMLHEKHKSNLFRSKTDRVIAGVCGGIAEYFGLDSSLIRIAWVIFTLFSGSGIILYIICWIIVPENQSNKSDLRTKGKRP